MLLPSLTTRTTFDGCSVLQPASTTLAELVCDTTTSPTTLDSIPNCISSSPR